MRRPVFGGKGRYDEPVKSRACNRDRPRQFPNAVVPRGTPVCATTTTTTTTPRPKRSIVSACLREGDAVRPAARPLATAAGSWSPEDDQGMTPSPPALTPDQDGSWRFPHSASSWKPDRAAKDSGFNESALPAHVGPASALMVKEDRAAELQLAAAGGRAYEGTQSSNAPKQISIVPKPILDTAMTSSPTTSATNQGDVLLPRQRRRQVPHDPGRPRRTRRAQRGPTFWR